MKNLPVQFVETRGERDVFLKEGGGGNDVPKWITEATIEQNAVHLRNIMKGLESEFENRKDMPDSDLPIIVVGFLHEKATAKSYRGNIRHIFDDKHKRNIIGMLKSRELIIKIDNKADLLRIASNFHEEELPSLGKVKRCGIAAIVGMERYHAFVEENLIGHSLKVRLFDYLDHDLNEKSEKLFLQTCKDCGLKVKKANYAQGLRIFSIENCQDQQSIQRIATMDSVIFVKKMPYIQLSLSPEPYNTELEVKKPVEGEVYPLIGLLDSGVANIPHLTPWLRGENQNIADFDDDDLNFRHGTAVAGVMNYGDELENSNWTGCSPMEIVSCIINTNSNNIRVSETEMIEHIRSAVEKNPEVKIWNLSQGSSNEVDDEDFSEFGMALDDLQKKFNILFCKSAGNINPSRPNEDRITVGADSILSLVVGSIADKSEEEGDVPQGQKSPFSRKGPGPKNLIKPDLVHYGGNEKSKIHSFTEVGYQCSILSGTSFSTPRVAALASNLAQRIDRDFDPKLIKAILIHNANYQNISGLDNTSLLYEQGYGLPSNLNSMLNNDENEFTMIWNPPLVGGDAQIEDIPFPSSMVGKDGLFYGEIIVTIVTDPILKFREGTHYCQSDVEVLLQTYDGINYVPLNAIGTPRRYRNSDRLIKPKNILTKDNYSKSSWNNDWEERTFIEKILKNQPIKKFHVHLEQMTPKKRKEFLPSYKKWCLTVKTSYDDSALTDKKYEGLTEHTDAIIIITIKDTKKKRVTYSECIASLNQHGFTHSNVGICQRVENRNFDL